MPVDTVGPLVKVRLIVCGEDALFVQGGDELVSVLKSPGQRVLQIVLDLPKVIEEINQKVAPFPWPVFLFSFLFSWFCRHYPLCWLCQG